MADMQAPSDIASEEPAFELQDILRAIRSHFFLLLGIGVVITGAAAAIAFSMTPIYRVEVTMIAADDDSMGSLPSLLGGLGGVAAMAGINLGSKSDVEVSLAMLQSRRFLSSFIKENGLLQDFFAKKWDAQAKAWKGSPADAPTMDDGVLLMERGVMAVTRDRRTGLITLSIEWSDRRKAALWANQLVMRVNELLRQQAIDQARQSIEFLNKELVKTNVLELQQAIYRLTETQINRIVMANVRQEFAFKVIDPAVAPDAKYKVRPKRLIIVLFGAALGGVVCLALAVLFAFRARRKAAPNVTRVPA